MDDVKKIRHVVLLLLYRLLQCVQIRLDILNLSLVVLHRLRPCLKERGHGHRVYSSTCQQNKIHPYLLNVIPRPDVDDNILRTL